MGVSSFLGLGFMFITYNPDTPALQLLHNNSYTTHQQHAGIIFLPFTKWRFRTVPEFGGTWVKIL
jgi:hypothetical protein